MQCTVDCPDCDHRLRGAIPGGPLPLPRARPSPRPAFTEGARPGGAIRCCGRAGTGLKVSRSALPGAASRAEGIYPSPPARNRIFEGPWARRERQQSVGRLRDQDIRPSWPVTREEGIVPLKGFGRTTGQLAIARVPVSLGSDGLEGTHFEWKRSNTPICRKNLKVAGGTNGKLSLSSEWSSRLDWSSAFIEPDRSSRPTRPWPPCRRPWPRSSPPPHPTLSRTDHRPRLRLV